MNSTARPTSKRSAMLRGMTAVRFAAALLVVAAVAAGCSKSSGASGSSASGQAAQPSASGATQRQLPGASGELVALSGKTLQVQNTTSQTSVNYTATTNFSDTVASSAAALKVGLCASVRPATSSTAPSAGASAAAASPGTNGTLPTSVDAATVTLSDPVNGRCSGGFGGGFGGGAGGNFTGRPSGAPSGFAPGGGSAPSGSTGRPGGARAGGFGANGLISSVSGSSFVVTVERRARASSSSASGATAAPTTELVTAHFTSATKFTRQERATAAALQVGQCVTAIGSADDTGAITATTISLRPKTNGTCSFGGFGG